MPLQRVGDDWGGPNGAGRAYTRRTMGERQLAAVVQRTDGRRAVVGLRDANRSPAGVTSRVLDWLQRLFGRA